MLAGQRPPADAGKVYAYGRTYADTTLIHDYPAGLRLHEVEAYIKRRVADAYVAGWYAAKRGESGSTAQRTEAP